MKNLSYQNQAIALKYLEMATGRYWEVLITPTPLLKLLHMLLEKYLSNRK